MQSLYAKRNAWLQSLINDEIKRTVRAFLNDEEPTRPCATCGRMFHPRSRYHFFDKKACRREWYKGQFHPRD